MVVALKRLYDIETSIKKVKHLSDDIVDFSPIYGLPDLTIEYLLIPKEFEICGKYNALDVEDAIWEAGKKHILNKHNMLKAALKALEANKTCVEFVLTSYGTQIEIGKRLMQLVEKNKKALEPWGVRGVSFSSSAGRNGHGFLGVAGIVLNFETPDRALWKNYNTGVEFMLERFLYGKIEDIVCDEQCFKVIDMLLNDYTVEDFDRFTVLFHMLLQNFPVIGHFRLVDGGIELFEDTWPPQDLAILTPLMDENNIVRFNGIEELQMSIDLLRG